MSAHLERAQLLLAQSRAADAEQEAMRALAQEPANPAALVLLALSRLHQDKPALALEVAREAIGLAPDWPTAHRVHAAILQRLLREDDAFRAVQEAIRLDPADADNFAVLASIELARRRWSAALEAAERALQIDPEHVDAANLRSMSLVHLGRKAEAMDTVAATLAREPDNAFSHANQGWNCLHRNEPRQAQEHFREALRLQPDLEYAREGMVEALKARNPVYRVMLAYFLWTSRLAAGHQWVVLAATFFGSRMLSRAAAESSGPKWVWWVVLGLFYGFIYLTWTAQPMFNLALRVHPLGRHALSAAQRTAANWFGVVFAAALAALVWFFVTDTNRAFFTMFFLAALSICVAATFARTGRARLILGGSSVALAVTAALALTPLSGLPPPDRFISLFVFGFLGFQILANVLATTRALR